MTNPKTEVTAKIYAKADIVGIGAGIEITRKLELQVDDENSAIAVLKRLIFGDKIK